MDAADTLFVVHVTAFLCSDWMTALYRNFFVTDKIAIFAKMMFSMPRREFMEVMVIKKLKTNQPMAEQLARKLLIQLTMVCILDR